MMIIVIFHIYWDKPGNQGRSPVKDGKILLSFFHFQCSLAIATCGLWICDELFFWCRLQTALLEASGKILMFPIASLVLIQSSVLFHSFVYGWKGM